MYHSTERLALLRAQFDDIAFSEVTRCRVHTTVHSVLLSHFVARGIRTCCVSTCRAPFLLPSRTTFFRRRPPSSSSTSSSSSSLFDPSRSQARRMELPRAHVTRASRIDRTRAGRNVAIERDELHGTLMVTVTDHVGARIFSPSRRSSRIHHRNSDTLGRGVNNDCIRGLKLILSKGAPTIETNRIILRNVAFLNEIFIKQNIYDIRSFQSVILFHYCSNNSSLRATSNPSTTFWEFENVRVDGSPRVREAKETIDHLLLKRLYRVFARESPCRRD